MYLYAVGPVSQPDLRRLSTASIKRNKDSSYSADCWSSCRHEMRNPLSAILQSADGIAKSLTEFRSSSKTLVLSNELVESSLEAVEIITLCAQHQSRIINDVLTLSKLDSEMLQVAPIVVQPIAVVKGALKMFEGELLSHNISSSFVSDQSYHQLNIDWVMADPSRVTQVSRLHDLGCFYIG